MHIHCRLQNGFQFRTSPSCSSSPQEDPEIGRGCREQNCSWRGMWSLLCSLIVSLKTCSCTLWICFISPGDPETSKCNQRNAWKQAKWLNSLVPRRNEPGDEANDWFAMIVVSQATPFTERERVWHAAAIKLTPQQKLAVTNEIRTLRRLHPLSWSNNYVTCLADVSILLSNGTVW